METSKVKRWIGYGRFVMLFIMTACNGVWPKATAVSSPVPTATPMPPPFKIIAYVTDAVIVDQVPFDKLTHINYAFAIPNADGALKPLGNQWKIDQLIEQAHEQGVLVLIAVGGWGHDETFEMLAASPEARERLVAELVALVEKYGFDGVDMDWEYPDPGDSAQNYAQLMAALGAKMHGRDKLLTAAVAALGGNADGVTDPVFEMVDFLNLMAYDQSDDDHSPVAYAQASLAYWRGRGLPSEKMVLGVPFYGRPDWIPYHKLIASDPAAANKDVIEYNGILVNYNGIPAIQQKTELALDNASGIMFWTLAYDTQDETSLLGTIYDEVAK